MGCNETFQISEFPLIFDGLDDTLVAESYATLRALPRAIADYSRSAWLFGVIVICSEPIARASWDHESCHPGPHQAS